MKGDNKRKSLFKFRLNLQRRSEISFFYENRYSWFVNKEIYIRWVTSFFFAIMPFTIAMTILTSFSKSIDELDLGVLIFIITLSSIIMSCLIFSQSKSTAKTKIKWRNKFFYAAQLDFYSFLLSILYFIIVLCYCYNTVEIKPSHLIWSTENFYTFIFWTGISLIFGLIYYIFHITIAIHYWNRIYSAIVSTILFYVLFLGVPYLQYLIVHDEPFYIDSSISSIISYISPLVIGIGASGSVKRDYEEMQLYFTEGIIFSLIFYTLIIALLLFKFRKTFKRIEVLDEID